MASAKIAQLLTGLLSNSQIKTASDTLLKTVNHEVDADEIGAPRSETDIESSYATNTKEVKLCFGIKCLDDFFSGKATPSTPNQTLHPSCRAVGSQHLHRATHSSSLQDGGLSFGNLIEMGIPFGNGGRRLLAHFMAAATSGQSNGQKLWCLWISARQQPAVYPPAWQALGVDLKHLRFASCESPVSELRAVFLDDFFRVIVIDHPSALPPDEHVFLAQSARKHNKIIVVARDGLLSPRDSNTAARYRLNIWRPAHQNILELTPVRGLHHKLQLSSFFQHPNFAPAG